jgi:hypothetical protein
MLYLNFLFEYQMCIILILYEKSIQFFPWIHLLLYSLSWSNGKGTLLIGRTTNILTFTQTIRLRFGQPGPVGRSETGTFATGNASQETGIFACALGIIFGLGFFTRNLGSLARFVHCQLFGSSYCYCWSSSQETRNTHTTGKTEGRTQEVSSIHDILQFAAIR